MEGSFFLSQPAGTGAVFQSTQASAAFLAAGRGARDEAAALAGRAGAWCPAPDPAKLLPDRLSGSGAAAAGAAAAAAVLALGDAPAAAAATAGAA